MLIWSPLLSKHGQIYPKIGLKLAKNRFFEDFVRFITYQSILEALHMTLWTRFMTFWGRICLRNNILAVQRSKFRSIVHPPLDYPKRGGPSVELSLNRTALHNTICTVMIVPYIIDKICLKQNYTKYLEPNFSPYHLKNYKEIPLSTNYFLLYC